MYWTRPFKELHPLQGPSYFCNIFSWRQRNENLSTHMHNKCICQFFSESSSSLHVTRSSGTTSVFISNGTTGIPRMRNYLTSLWRQKSMWLRTPVCNFVLLRLSKLIIRRHVAVRIDSSSRDVRCEFSRFIVLRKLSFPSSYVLRTDIPDINHIIIDVMRTDVKFILKLIKFSFPEKSLLNRSVEKKRKKKIMGKCIDDYFRVVWAAVYLVDVIIVSTTVK